MTTTTQAPTDRNVRASIVAAIAEAEERATSAAMSATRWTNAAHLGGYAQGLRAALRIMEDRA